MSFNIIISRFVEAHVTQNNAIFFPVLISLPKPLTVSYILHINHGNGHENHTTCTACISRLVYEDYSHGFVWENIMQKRTIGQ